MVANKGCEVFPTWGFMLRPSAQRLPQQVGRGGAIPLCGGTSFRPEDRKVAKCGNHFATGERDRSAARPTPRIGLKRANPLRKPKAQSQRLRRKRCARGRLGLGVTTLVRSRLLSQAAGAQFHRHGSDRPRMPFVLAPVRAWPESFQALERSHPARPSQHHLQLEAET